MQLIILLIHVFVAFGIIGLVLMQHGKGASMGAGFGGGASQTMFGSVGATPFIVKLVGILGALFFITSLSLGYLIAHQPKSGASFKLPTHQSAPKKTRSKK